MPTLINARRQFKSRLDTKQNVLHPTPALMGDGNGNVQVPGQPGYVYIRVGVGDLGQAFNNRCPLIDNLAIYVGYDPVTDYDCRIFQVLNVRMVDYAGSGNVPTPFVGPHHQTHEYGGGDDVYVSWRRIMGFRVGRPAGFVITIDGGNIIRTGAWLAVLSQTIDLTASKPVVSGQARYVLIVLDSTGTATATNGALVAVGMLDISDCPIPGAGKIPLAAVRLYGTQTAIGDTPTAPDIVDLRFPQAASAGAVYLADLDGYARGSIIRGGATDWESYALGGISGSVVTRNATDVIWSAGALSFAGAFTLTIPATGTAVLGTGTQYQVALWSGTNTIAGLGSLGTANAVFQSVGAGANPAWSGFLLTGTAGGTTNFAITNTKTLTLTATDSYDLTIPATGTAALGTGTASYCTRWSGTNTIGNSIIQDNATTASIGIAPIANQIFTIRTATATNLGLTVQSTDGSTTKNCFSISKIIAGTAYQMFQADANGFVCSTTTGNRYHTKYMYEAAYYYNSDMAANWGGMFITCSTSSAQSGLVRGIDMLMVANQAAGVITSLIGLNFQINTSNSGGTNTLVAGVVGKIYGDVAGGTSTGVIGIQGTNHLDANQTWTNCYCVQAALSQSAGTIGSWAGFYVSTSGRTAGTMNTAYGLYIENINFASTNYCIYTNAGVNRLGDQLSIVGSADRQQLIVTGYSTQAVATTVAQVTRADTVAGVSAMLGLTALGSGANGDGGSILMNGKSSTTAAQAMGLDEWLWVDATHASRKARRIWSVYDTAVREGLRIEASGTAPMISFYGGTAVARGAALTAQLTTLTYTAPGTPDYAIQDFAQNGGAGIWGFADHDEANTILSVIANLQTRVAELEARLGSATGVNLFA